MNTIVVDAVKNEEGKTVRLEFRGECREKVEPAVALSRPAAVILGSSRAVRSWRWCWWTAALVDGGLPVAGARPRGPVGLPCPSRWKPPATELGRLVNAIKPRCLPTARWLISLLVGLVTAGQLAGQNPVLLDCPQLRESSGAALSRNDSALVWTHNDSGNRPQLFLLERATGRLRGIYELPGVHARDLEDMCAFRIGQKNYLALGDIGDNHRRRRRIEIIIVEEPQSAVVTTEVAVAQTVAPTIELQRILRLPVRYPDGAVDCESLAFDATHSRFLLVTKELFRARIFSVPVDLALVDAAFDHGSTEFPISQAHYLQTLRIPIATAADISPDDRTLAIGTYGPAYLLERRGELWSERTMQRVPLPSRRQGEAIAFAGDQRLLLTSEFAPTPLWTVDISVWRVP